MTEPELTVLVTAYRRSRFLAEALRSAIDQSLDRARYEIVLLTNVEEPGLFGRLAGSGIVRPPVSEGSWGDWVVAALPHCRAPLIGFLDDDDLFLPQKLSAVLSVFREHPTIQYYHNRIDPFLDSPTGGGSNAPGGRTRLIGPTVGLVEDRGKDRRRSARLFWERGGFNASAMVVRRELIEGSAPLLRSLLGGQPLALFYAALAGSGDLYFDGRALTRFRRHPGNRSTPTGSALVAEFRRAAHPDPAGIHDTSAAISADAERIARFVETNDPVRIASRPIRSVAARSRLVAALADSRPGRGAIAQAFGTYVRLTPLRVLARHRGLVMAAGLGLVRADLAGRWLERRGPGPAPGASPLTRGRT
jgi:hypothetical protein